MHGPDGATPLHGKLSVSGLRVTYSSGGKSVTGGMRKRVDVARAFAGDPETILMDEPFGGLDTQTKESLQEAILEIWNSKKKTILFVTHDLEEAAFLADRVFVLQKGGGLNIVPIDLPRPRTSAMRTEPALQSYRRLLGDLIRSQEESSSHVH
jgi:NitT/TauT family transport system ATP-binding protein